MSWLQLAAGLIRDAMHSGESAEPVERMPLPPTDISDIVKLIGHHRAQIDKNFETVVTMLNEQNERRLSAMRIQKRWNYGLAAAVIILGIVSIVLLRLLR